MKLLFFYTLFNLFCFFLWIPKNNNMLISAIVATDLNLAIGKNNQIPWSAPADMAFFKQKTLNHCVLMGFNTFLSLPKLLPNRCNIVLTKKNIAELNQNEAKLNQNKAKLNPNKAKLNPNITQTDTTSCFFVNDFLAAVQIAKSRAETELFIIGGQQIYTQLLPFCHQIYLSTIHTEIENADAYFPNIPKCFSLVQNKYREADEKTKYNLNFLLYQNTKVINLPQ
jgi:dihydrofolate reductase